jgi:hypothetical protein
MAIVARFDSECGICIGNIDEGVHDIEYTSDDGWVHVECLEDQDDEDEFASGD